MTMNVILIAGFMIFTGFGQSLGGDATTHPVSTFTDSTGTVSFRYSSAWTRVRRFESYSPSAAFTPHIKDDIKPEAVFEFNDRHFAKTELETLAFQFGHFKTSSSALCDKFADDHSIGDIGDVKPSNRQINGVRFRYSTGNGGASAGHDIEAQVYTTFRSGVCFVFEQDLTTEHVMDGVRELSTNEYKTLRNQTDSLMQSVKFMR